MGTSIIGPKSVFHLFAVLEHFRFEFLEQWLASHAPPNTGETRDRISPACSVTDFDNQN